MNKQSSISKSIWVPDNKTVWRKTKVKSETVTEVITEDDIKYKQTEIESANPDKFDMVPNLATLSYLNEPSVLHTLKNRYNSKKIYTESGIFHISVNPYESYGYKNLSLEEINKHKKKLINDINNKIYQGGPHIYKVAQKAFEMMAITGQNQSILVTGESGAGKTVNTQMLIEFLGVDESQPINILLTNANPILEAFGNAKTVKNDNSSRFGKFTQILFKGKVLVGARIENYLLELSRLNNRNSNERNFHIFYFLLSSKDSELLKKLKLENKKFSDFALTNSSISSANSINDIKTFKELREKFALFGLDEISIFKILSGLLFLSNLKFEQETPSSKITISPSSDEGLKTACELLEISEDDLIDAFLYPKITVKSVVQVSDRSLEATYELLSTLIKGIYLRLFNFIVNQINTSLLCTEYDTFIGILDIAGFEIFKVNSFEQLMINYTNEKLQQYFNHHMFIEEQRVYKEEGILWDYIDFGLDLEPTIAMIEASNPIGILAYLDEEAVMPCASDETLITKISKIHGIKKLNGVHKQFKLKHYAGEVIYNVDGWILKNKNPTSLEVERLLSNAWYNLSGISCNTSGKKGIFRTLSQDHKENLKSLILTLHSTRPHFVRCILPNLEKRPNLFENDLVVSQLNCNGVLEGLRISRLGFPNRINFSDFYNRYKFYLTLDSSLSIKSGSKCSAVSTQGEEFDVLEKTKEMLKILSNTFGLISESDYLLGHTKLFFKQGMLAELEHERDKHMIRMSEVLQSAIRFKIAMNKVKIEKLRKESSVIIFESVKSALTLQKSFWWSLFLTAKPFLAIRQTEEKEAAFKKEILELEKNVKQLESAIVVKDDQVTLLKEETKAEMDKFNSVIENLNLQVEDREELVNGLRVSKEEIQADLHSKIDEIEQLNILISTSQLEKEKLEGNLKEHKNEISQLNEKLNKSISAGNTSNEAVKEGEKSISLLNKQIKDLRDLIAHEGEESTKKLSSIIKERDVKFIKYEAELNQAKENKQALLEKVNQADGERDDLMHKIKISQKKVMDLQSQLESTAMERERILMEMEKGKSSNESEIQMLQQLIAKTKKEMREVASANDNLNSEISRSNAKEAKSENLVKTLEEENVHLSQKINRLNLFIEEANVTEKSNAETVDASVKSDLEFKIECLEESITDLREKNDFLYKENIELVDSKLHEMFKREIEIKSVKVNLTMEIAKLRKELKKSKEESVNANEAEFSMSRMKVMSLQQNNLDKISELELKNFELTQKLEGIDSDSIKAEIEEIKANIGKVLKIFSERFRNLLDSKQKAFNTELLGDEGDQQQQHHNEGILVLKSKCNALASENLALIEKFNMREVELMEMKQKLAERSKMRDYEKWKNLEVSFSAISEMMGDFIRKCSDNSKMVLEKGKSGYGEQGVDSTALTINSSSSSSSISSSDINQQVLIGISEEDFNRKIELDKANIKIRQLTRENDDLRANISLLNDCLAIIKKN